MGVAADPDRNAIWIADTFNSKIKRIDVRTGEVTKFKISYELDEPGGLTLYRNKLFIANTNAHKIIALDLQSRMSEVVNVRES
jgi:DNA-binding beta-propeller fold protein YncE